MSVLLEFAMFPTSDECRKGSSVSHQVAKIIDMIDQSGLAYQLTPMGTIVECERVYSTIKLDIRKGKTDRLNGKIESVEKQIGRSVKR
jgi:uncharacterized protein YqgV (UPF0045/DUF77 family)